MHSTMNKMPTPLAFMWLELNVISIQMKDCRECASLCLQWGREIHRKLPKRKSNNSNKTKNTWAYKMLGKSINLLSSQVNTLKTMYG